MIIPLVGLSSLKKLGLFVRHLLVRLSLPFNLISYLLGLLFSCSGECLVYGFDDLTGALQPSHKLVLSSKDYPGILYTTMNCHVPAIVCSQIIMA